MTKAEMAAKGLLLFVAFFIAGWVFCGCTPKTIKDPCSAVAYTAVDFTCLQIMAPAVARVCGDTPQDKCPTAIAAVAVCKAVRAEQEAECAR